MDLFCPRACKHHSLFCFTKTKMKKQRIDDDDDERDANNQALLAWIEREHAEQGTEGLLQNVVVRPWSLETKCASHLAGDKLLSIPLACMLTCEKAVDSPIGQAFSAYCNGKQVQPEQILWLYMIQAKFDVEHEFHAFMQYLPSRAPDLVNWDAEERDLLQDTILFPILQRVLEDLRAFAVLVEEFMQAKPEFRIAAFTFDSLCWARGHQRSRRFSDALNPHARITTVGRTDDGNASQINENGIGVMIPLLDKTNHDPDAKVSWRVSDKEIAFHCEQDLDHTTNKELKNNYGPKSNEMLLLDFGFALPDNVHDGVSLTLCVKEQDGGGLRRLGPFEVRRKSERWPTFPDKLWRALADPFGEEEGEAEDYEIGLDEIELLHAQLSHRLQLISNSEESDLALQPSDTNNRRYVAYYRCGQRDILRSSLAELDEMIGEDEEE